MAEQLPQPPASRDSRRKFLIRSARLGAAGLPLMATLHHRSALANTVCLTPSAASSMDVSGRDVFNPNECNKGASIQQYAEGSVAFPVAANIKVGEALNDTIGVVSTVDYETKQVKLLFSDYLTQGVTSPLREEALSLQTWFNALRAESSGSSYAISSEFAVALIRELFDGGGNTGHPYNLSPYASILDLFLGINN